MTKPVRILHVVSSLNPGGMENVLIRVAERLEARGFEVHACCLEGPGHLAPRFPCPERVIALRKQPGFRTATIRALRHAIRTVKPDIVHTHNLGPLIYSAPATFWGLGTVILHGEHAQLPPEEQTARRILARKLLYRATRRVHTVSRGLRDELVALGFAPERILPIVNGVDPETFAPGNRDEARRLLGIDSAGPVIGIVGRFRPCKRHDVLIDAMSRLPDDVLLVIAGDGPERAEISRLAESGPAGKRILFLGHRDDPRPCYRALDLLVVPSVAEGLSNAVLEAMATGIPILANDACGNAEAVTHGHEGWVLPLPDAAALAEALRQALHDPEDLARKGLAARERVVRDFSFAGTVDAYESAYRDLLNGRIHTP